MLSAAPWRALPDTGFDQIAGFADHGALRALEPLFDTLGTQRAGLRLRPDILRNLPIVAQITSVAVGYLGAEARPVRGLLFDKRSTGNWSLAWHQDRTIAVQRKIETAGFGPWTMKGGQQHVAPPVAFLARMMTVRLHLDPVDAENGPLLVAPGSHRLGLIPEREIESVVDRCGRFTCLAGSGDLWLYSTLILHASEAARFPRHRRVLQIDFSAEALPGGLDWAAAG